MLWSPKNSMKSFSKRCFPSKVEILLLRNKLTPTMNKFSKYRLEGIKIFPKILQEFKISRHIVSRKDFQHMINNLSNCYIIEINECIVDTLKLNFSPTIEFKIWKFNFDDSAGHK